MTEGAESMDPNVEGQYPVGQMRNGKSFRPDLGAIPKTTLRRGTHNPGAKGILSRVTPPLVID